jgi:xylulokinase
MSDRERDYAVDRGEDPYAFVSAPARDARPGSGGVVFLPYLMGEQAPIWDPDARGGFIGIAANTSRGDMVRAIMEGIAFGIRQNFQVFLDAGWSVGDVRIQGGAARNSLWNQIISDVTNLTVLVPAASSGAPIGDALIAGVATGVFPDVETAMAVCPEPKATHIPNAGNVEIYDRLYPVYESLYAEVRGSFRSLAEFRSWISEEADEVD